MYNNEPKPLNNNSLAVTPIAKELFNKTLDEQSEKGFEKYGTYLTFCNGRSAANDAFQELADLSQYVTQLAMEHKLMLAFIKYLIDAGFMPIEYLGDSLYTLYKSKTSLTEEEQKFYTDLFINEMTG